MSLRDIPTDRLPTLSAIDEGLHAAQVAAQRTCGFNDIVVHAASGWRVAARDTVQTPALRPLHGADWTLVAAASALMAALSFGLAARLRH